jgi:hypothetical protein
MTEKPRAKVDTPSISNDEFDNLSPLTEELKYLDREEVLPFTYEITSYGADYDVTGLIRRLSNNTILIPPFQRSYVWSLRIASRFIESLLLGLPVPGIFLSREPDTNKLLVIDGQQRLNTLRYFHDGVFLPTKREFALKFVQNKYLGKTYQTLSPADRLRFDDSIIHTTVVRQDEPSDDSSSIYYLFERLNTGSIELAAQQIRAAIYHGPFSDTLKHLNENASWRILYGAKDNKMRDQELILRFLALYFFHDDYKKPMKEFLNKYMGGNRNFLLQSEDQIIRAFVPTVETIQRYIGDTAFRWKRGRNVAFAEAVMLGIAYRLERGTVNNYATLRERFNNLSNNLDFAQVTETATTDEENIKKRIRIVREVFADVP